MKYRLIEVLFGWLFRPILLWNVWDMLIVLLEVALIWIWISNIIQFIKSKKKRKLLYKRYKRELRKMKMRGDM